MARCISAKKVAGLVLTMATFDFVLMFPILRMLVSNFWPSDHKEIPETTQRKALQKDA